MSDDDDTMLSRSGRTDPAGKLSRGLDLRMSEDMESDLIGMATIMGINKSELARRIIERALYGEVSMVRKATRASGLRLWDECPTNVGRHG